MLRATRITRTVAINNFDARLASCQTDEEAALLLGWRFDPFITVHDPYLQNNRIGALMNSLEVLKENRCEIGISTYRIALYISRTSKKQWAAEKIMAEIKNRKITPDPSLQSAILDCLCHLERRRYATAAMHSYFNTLAAPSEYDYRNIIFALARLREPQKGFAIYKQCLSVTIPTKRVFEAAIVSCESYSLCKSVLSDMKLFGILPNEYTINSLLRVCAATKDVQNAEKVVEMAKQSNFHSAAIDSYLLSVYRKAKDWTRYDAFYKKVISADLQANPSAHTSHMRVLSERGDTNGALILFGKLLRQGQIRSVQGWREITYVAIAEKSIQLALDLARVYIRLRVRKIEHFEAMVYQITGFRISQVPPGPLPSWFVDDMSFRSKQPRDYLPPLWLAALEQAVQERETRLELLAAQ
eukprot:TRINITY_DN72_c6_g1_i1.p1 TRINITY_DN72_c6_g1~~TRINITY_DN72_c6_g1_i1.p1  ORF type:complete len:414 (+),score=55.24 TRINITY_DN72_c6_g1_i1:75-1316(+)